MLCGTHRDCHRHIARCPLGYCSCHPRDAYGCLLRAGASCRPRCCRPSPSVGLPPTPTLRSMDSVMHKLQAENEVPLPFRPASSWDTSVCTRVLPGSGWAPLSERARAQCTGLVSVLCRLRFGTSWCIGTPLPTPFPRRWVCTGGGHHLRVLAGFWSPRLRVPDQSKVLATP